MLRVDFAVRLFSPNLFELFVLEVPVGLIGPLLKLDIVEFPRPVGFLAWKLFEWLELFWRVLTPILEWEELLVCL